MEKNIVNEFFDEVFCINLDRRNDRWLEMDKKFRKLNIFATRISGTDKLIPDVKKDYSLLLKEKPNTTIKTAGAYAILLTYLKLFKFILNNTKLNKVLIFEDDVLFNKNFNNEFKFQSQALPDDWGMWLLSSSQIGGTELEYTPGKIFYHPNRTYGLFTFAINRNYLPIAISILEKRLSPADTEIISYRDSNNKSYVYVSTKKLTQHDYGYSDNLDRDFTKEFVMNSKDKWRHRIINESEFE